MVTHHPLCVQVFSTYRFKFDRVHDPGSEQAEVYTLSAKGIVANAIQVGYVHTSYIRLVCGCFCGPQCNISLVAFGWQQY